MPLMRCSALGLPVPLMLHMDPVSGLLCKRYQYGQISPCDLLLHCRHWQTCMPVQQYGLAVLAVWHQASADWALSQLSSLGGSSKAAMHCLQLPL